MFITQRTPSLAVATRLAAAGFVQAMSPALRQDVEHHLREGQIIYSTVDGQRVIGLSIFATMGRQQEILYLAGTIFLPGAQQRGLAAAAIHRARVECHSEYLALRTQSPRMWSVGRRICSEWYPQATAAISPKLREIGEIVSRHIGSNFPFAPGHYGGPLYGQKPTHHDPLLQAWWDSICNFERGDAVLCVGKF